MVSRRCVPSPFGALSTKLWDGSARRGPHCTQVPIHWKEHDRFRRKSMVPISRRRFLKKSVVSVAGLSALSYGRAADSPNDKVVLAFIGIGSTVPGSVGGRGRQLIRPFFSFKDVDIAYLCDIDESFFPFGQQLLSGAQRQDAKVVKDL